MEIEEESGEALGGLCFNRTFMQGFKEILLFFPSFFQVSTCAYVTQKVEFAGIRYLANISLRAGR